MELKSLSIILCSILTFCPSLCHKHRHRRSICVSGNKCYDSVYGECFPCKFGFHAKSPEKIAMTFHLHTPSDSQVFQWDNVSAAAESAATKLNINTDLWVIIHGFEGQWPLPWLEMMKKALIDKGNNVLVAQWTKGTSYPHNYAQASANGLVVGAMTAKVIKLVSNSSGLSLDNVNILGFSLGAPIAGHTGARLDGKAKQIVGLDSPAQLYNGKPPEYRLDPTDGQLVQAIHTHGESLASGGLGTMDQVGDIDIYVNGGKRQHGCPVTERKNMKIEGLYDIILIVGCNHLRAPALFTDSIINDKCKYKAYPCDARTNWKLGLCFQCPDEGCINMGYRMDAKTKQRGKFYLATEVDQGVNEPDVAYCGTQYRVTLVPDGKVEGTVEVAIQHDKNSSRSRSNLQTVSKTMTPDLPKSFIVAGGLTEPKWLRIFYDRFNVVVKKGNEKFNLKEARVVKDDGSGYFFNGTHEVVDDYETQVALVPGKIDLEAELAESRVKLTSGAEKLYAIPMILSLGLLSHLVLSGCGPRQGATLWITLFMNIFPTVANDLL